jgi:hypothetical protein
MQTILSYLLFAGLPDVAFRSLNDGRSRESKRRVKSRAKLGVQTMGEVGCLTRRDEVWPLQTHFFYPGNQRRRVHA